MNIDKVDFNFTFYLPVIVFVIFPLRLSADYYKEAKRKQTILQATFCVLSEFSMANRFKTIAL